MTGLAYLLSGPLQTHQEQKNTNDGQETTHPIDALKNLAAAVALGIETVWGPVEENGEDEGEEIPNANQNTNIAPARGLQDELGVEDRRTEWYNCEDDGADVGATLGGRHELTRTSKGNEFVDPSAQAVEDHTGNENVHVLGC